MKQQRGFKKNNRIRQPKDSINETFRRNNVVFSSRQKEMTSRQQSVSQRQADLKRSIARRHMKRQFIGSIIIILVALFLFRMQITSVNITSNAASKIQETESSQYKASILDQYQQATVFNQSWLMNTETLTQNIMKMYPEIERISFSDSAPLSTALNTDIRFRKPVFTWQDASGVPQFVDANGVLFTKNLDPTVDVEKLIEIEDQSGVVLDVGASVLTTNLISFIGQLHDYVPSLYGETAEVTKVIIPQSTREVRVQVTDQPYLLKFNSTRDLEVQVQELRVLTTYLTEQGITPAEYIDLRVAHKAFYK